MQDEMILPYIIGRIYVASPMVFNGNIEEGSPFSKDIEL